MKQIYVFWMCLLLLVGLSACTDEVAVENGQETVAEGDVALQLSVSVPDAKVVTTRDIDPDGLGIKTLYLFCFDGYGSYIGRRDASNIRLDGGENGNYAYTFDVTVPSSTRRIHFLSNVYLDDINAVPGMSETTLIPSIVSASGLMAYWGRVAVTDLESNNIPSIVLYRNQAQVCWEVGSGVGLHVFGYAVCNRRAWGTIAPFNPHAEKDEDKFNYSLDAPYVTEPAADYQVLSTDATDVTVQGDEAQGDPHYIFENPNTLDAPVYAVMLIGETKESAKYYKIMFVDGNKNLLPIYRNFKYVIRINSAPPESMGYTTFDEAKEGIAANNAWVSVDPEIPELSDGTHTLNILNGTTQIFNEGGEQTIDFTYDGNSEDVSVSWLDNDGTLSSVTPQLSSTGNNTYTITMNLAQPKEDPVIGTLLLRAGVFTRQIKVYLMKPFEFKPVWVSTGVPMKKDERLSMTFVIPDNYPSELFPITCKIATNTMNANDDLEVQLPVIIEDCEYHIETEDGEPKEPNRTANWGYKFVYTATRPGIQEVFFTLNVSEGNDPEGTVEYVGSSCPYLTEKQNHAHVFLEAENFKDEEKVVLFQSGSKDMYITMDGADENNPGFLLKELAPTVNQPVTIKLNFTGGTPTTNTVMRIATTSLVPVDSEKNKYINNGTPTTNGIVNYYWIKPGKVSSLTLNFLTNTPDVDDLVRFSIDNENEFGYNSNSDDWFKSAAVELRATPKNFTFDFNIVDDTPEVDAVKYGLNQPANMYLTIPEAAVQYTDLKLFIQTNNLKRDPNGEHAEWLEETVGGYYLTIPKGTSLEQRGTIKFLTSRIASAETVTIRTADNSQALFTPASASFTNLPITGTLTLDGEEPLSNNSFITLQRKNGTRVGDLDIQSVEGNIATYKLTLRPEYDFTMDEDLIVYYTVPNTSVVYQLTATFSYLVSHEIGESVPLITLKKQ